MVQEYSGWFLAWLALQSTGVIYGDIGTSPLYVYSSTFSSNPSYDDLVGALSIIIWTLTLIVTVKYVCIVLRADDDGEGGTFAVYSLLSRYARIGGQDPNTARAIKLERYLSTDMKPTNKGVRNFLEGSRASKAILKIVGVVGVALIMADGVLTPAQSVLGSIQGLKVVAPNISTGTIIGVTCAILILLFLIQPFGTSKLGTTYAPVVIIWLMFNLCFGIYNLVKFDHTVLKAFSPYFAGYYFVRNGTDGWRSLGGILLAFTGVEALFADLGAFSRRAIQLSWICFAYPCLLFAYIGQAAYISKDVTQTAYSNPFFNTVPPGMLYPSLVIAILATVVASQAMITSSFQLLSQVMRLSYFPHIKMIHTSKYFHGQIYIPMANWLLMIGTVIVTAVYNNTTSLGNAYGVCVVMVTFITTCMISLVALIIWRLHFTIVLAFFIVFGTLDGLYLSSVLTKVPQGAWFTLLLAFILSTIFILWRYGKEQQWKAENTDRFQPGQLMKKNENGQFRLTDAFGGAIVTNISGIGIFFDKAGDLVPLVYANFVRKFEASPAVSIFFHMRHLPTPSIPEAQRYIISRTSIPSCYRVIVRSGYMDDIITADLARMLVDQITLYITSNQGRVSLANPVNIENSAPDPDMDARIGAELLALQNAQSQQTVYIVGKEQMRIAPGTNIVRKILLGVFLWIRENARSKIVGLNIPMEQLVEVGFVKEI
ncbi:hypothetical protein OIDMADRAFT_130351 [Oidiodendron maius Zn]|uniref:Potassium transporter n=1 Tax=Oidiodendron maius (strain Zn) TaxID=913774 RepID=A0A0C3GMW1_OIDMZ|nr:hypothetical protein OIDMADRAFT_130351 [Oidiodendron maius Zn]